MASIKRNFLYNLLLQISKVLFPLITAPYIARTLNPEGVGIVNFVNTYASYFTLFAVLGIPLYAVREIAKIRDNIRALELFVSQMISLELVTTLFISCIYIISIYFIGQLNEHSVLFLIAGISLYITPFKIEWFFSGKEEFGYITFRSLIIKTISVILLFFVVKDKDDLINYIILNLFATVANEFWNYVKLYKIGIRPHFTLKDCKKHIKPILTLFASSIAVSIYVMLDTLMLGFQSTYQEVGYYNSSMHLIKTLLPVTTSLSAVVIPKLSLYIKNNDIETINILMTKSLDVVSFLAFPITLGVILIAPTFVPLFFGEQFLGAVLPMQIGAGVIVAIGLNNLSCIQIFTGISKDSLLLVSVLTGAIVNFIMNLTLIPLMGASGAALASVLAETVILIVSTWLLYHYTKVRYNDLSNMIKAAIGSLLFIPIIYLCNKILDGWSLIFSSVFLCILIYSLAQILLKNTIVKVIYTTLESKIYQIFGRIWIKK